VSFEKLYHAFAVRVEQIQVAPDKFIHVQVGLAIWCLSALVLRRSLRSPVPLAICILAEVANEVLDRMAAGSWKWGDTAGDALATWFWPVVLFAILRFNKRARS
jgi:hypothetical protein